MDYKNFLDNYNTYNEWNRIVKKEAQEEKDLWEAEETINLGGVLPFPNLSSVSFGDTINFTPEDDRVNSPSHYKGGKQEAIEIIEDAINNAPTMAAAMSQGQVLKYMLRCWLKDNPLEDLKKARWYLNRLISHLEGEG